MKFSQRIGKTPIREILQIDSIDKPLETRMWNDILNNFFYKLNSATLDQACESLWTEFFTERIDEIPTSNFNGRLSPDGVIRYIKNWYSKASWYEKYDFIEELAYLNIKALPEVDFVEACNYSLEKELSGYRIVEDKVIRITSDEEITEIEEAFSNAKNWKSVETHLHSSLSLLSNREKPDYRNSVKESISAVEALCLIITGDKSASLGKTLSIIDKKYKIHPALKSAFSSLYGYTSDSGGIRHALLKDDIKVTFEDAKFMLVSCSAFINYLKIRSEL